MMKLKEKTIFDIHELIKKKELSVLEVAGYFLNEIKNNDKNIKAFLEVNDAILDEAKLIDKQIRGGSEINLLTGIPVAIKDNIAIEGKRTTAGSKILEDYIAPYDATVIRKLRERDVIFLGKTNLDEFAMGSSTENSGFFTTKNPHDLSRVPGGSSGGSAAAVAAGECPLALGSDTGGSIRQPAAFCGVVGLKPTYGSVSRYGLIALASSLDVIGPLTKTVKEAAHVFYAISGRDKLDSTSFEDYDVSTPNDIFRRDPKKLKIGIPKEYFPKELDGKIRTKINSIIERLSKEGFCIEETSLPHTEYALATYYVIMPSEASANLARYDSLRYGKRLKQKSKNLADFYIQERTNKFGDETRRRIILGVYALSSGYYDDYYLKAQKTRQAITNEFQDCFEKYDLLITPTTPTPAFKEDEKRSPLEMYMSDIFTVPASLAGLPALSLPCGKVGNLPIGLQVIGKRFREEDIFVLTNYIEKILEEK